MHRAARHGIGRDPGRGYHGKLHVRHGKRWPPPGTVSEPFSSRWPTIRHPYLSGDFCCRCVALPVQSRSTAATIHLRVCVYTIYYTCFANLRYNFTSFFFPVDQEFWLENLLVLKFLATIFFFLKLSNQFKILEWNSRILSTLVILRSYSVRIEARLL